MEALPDERLASATGFLIRALRWLRERGVRVEQVMTDYGSAHVSKLFAKVLRRLKTRHQRPGLTRPIPTARPNASSRS